jgi:hypothetical protein
MKFHTPDRLGFQSEYLWQSLLFRNRNLASTPVANELLFKKQSAFQFVGPSAGVFPISAFPNIYF